MVTGIRGGGILPRAHIGEHWDSLVTLEDCSVGEVESVGRFMKHSSKQMGRVPERRQDRTVLGTS